MKLTENSPFVMAVVHDLKNWLLKLQEIWIWITSSLSPVFAIDHGEKQAILDWVASYVTQPPTDFAECWRDGILLCELADNFSPELFHGLGILDPKNCFGNVSLALEIIKARFEMDPDITPEDIVTCAPEAEDKLFHLLMKLKEKVESKGAEDAESLNELNSFAEESEDSTENDCFAQGAGLMVGFLGHKANFIVFSNDSVSNPDLVVEIKGPDGTYCCERVTKRSPKHKNTLSYLEAPRPRISHCGRSRSQTDLWTIDDTLKKDSKMIPLEYEIKGDFISVGYVPLKTGQHTIILLWHGRYVTGCPFGAVIEDSFDVHRNTSYIVRPPILRKATRKTPLLKKSSVRFKDPETNKIKLGKVKSRRVLRYIVKIGKKDVIVEAESTNMLASALRKLDLPSEGFGLGPRRNSWGFAGDTLSQRRLSLIRQLSFDKDEELQDEGRPQKRSSSLNLPMNADTNYDNNINGSFAVSCPYPLSFVDKTSDLVGDKSTPGDIPFSRESDFNKGKNTISSKFSKLETVPEGKIQFSSFTPRTSAETGAKGNSSEGEVFYRDTYTSVSEHVHARYLDKGNEISKNSKVAVLCQDEKLNTEMKAKSVITSITDDSKGQHEYMIQDCVTSNNVGLEIYSASEESKSKVLSKKQVEDDADDITQSDEKIKQQQGSMCQELSNSPDMETSDVLLAKGDMQKLHPKEETGSFENNTASLAVSDDPTAPNLELYRDLDVKPKNVHNEERSLAYLSSLNRVVCHCPACLTPNAALRTEEEDIDEDSNYAINENKFQHRRTVPLSLGENGETCALEDQNTAHLVECSEQVVPGSKAIAAEEEKFVRKFHNSCNCEDLTIKQSTIEGKTASPKWNIAEDIVPFNATNMKHKETPDILHNHKDSCEKKNQNCLNKVETKNSQGLDVFMKSTPLLNVRHSSDSYLLLSAGLRPNYNLTHYPNSIAWHETESMTHDIPKDQTALESDNGAEDYFPESANSAKSENRLKLSKASRVLSHPYLKDANYRMENSNPRTVSQLSDENKSRNLETTNNERIGRTAEIGPCCERIFSNSACENKEAQENSSFKWPASFSNNRKYVLESETENLYQSKVDEHSLERGGKEGKQISKMKPLKFSLESYKDKYHKECEEELVPSNSVKTIVKDFLSRSLECPSPHSNKSNDIYLGGGFFPPLAANEGRKTIRNHISEWEKSRSTSEMKTHLLGANKSSVGDKLSLYVNVQSKVAFWENAYYTSEGVDIPEEETWSVKPSDYTSKCVPEMEDDSTELKQQQQLNTTGFEALQDSGSSAPWKSQPHSTSTSRPVTSQQTEDSGISDDLLMCLKTSDRKRTPVLSRQRSLSDPCLGTRSTRPTDLLFNLEENLNIIPSSLSCTSEEDSEEASSETHCANDEYIDDEIPDYAAMFLGDYISFTGLLGPERSSSRKEVSTHYLQKLEDKSQHIFDPSLSRPEECRVLGVGVHYGLVSMKNRFQVLTKGAGRGNLSVSIQGSGRHDVTIIMVTYVRNDVYDVIYQVLEPGYYIISVRWSDWSIPGSPFICKVTY